MKHTQTEKLMDSAGILVPNFKSRKQYIVNHDLDHLRSFLEMKVATTNYSQWEMPASKH